MWLSLLLVGCPTPDTCRPMDTPEALLGWGESRFEAPADGAEVELVFGSQGGFHLPLAVDAIGLDTSELVVGNFVGLVDGVEVARGEPWLDFRCNPVTATQQSWNILLFFEIDANREDFFGRDIDVSGSLRDAMGREVLLEATMTIADGSN